MSRLSSYPASSFSPREYPGRHRTRDGSPRSLAAPLPGLSISSFFPSSGLVSSAILSRKLIDLSTSRLSRRPRRGRQLPFRLQQGVSGSRATVALFTGIVEEMGTVRRLDQGGKDGGWVLEVEAETTRNGTQLGDSIAINGTCLTVTSLQDRGFTFGLAPETLRRTNLGDLVPGSLVNLERSLQPDGRMGGHFVQGHVDGTGTIVSFSPEGDSLWVRVQAPPQLMRYIVPKGYIAVDGTSLTVVQVDDEAVTGPWFSFMLVAYTQQKIVIPHKGVGSRVNLEVDIVGKYVERMLQAFQHDK